MRWINDWNLADAFGWELMHVQTSLPGMLTFTDVAAILNAIRSGEHDVAIGLATLRILLRVPTDNRHTSSVLQGVGLVAT